MPISYSLNFYHHFAYGWKSLIKCWYLLKHVINQSQPKPAEIHKIWQKKPKLYGGNRLGSINRLVVGYQFFHYWPSHFSFSAKNMQVFRFCSLIRMQAFRSLSSIWASPQYLNFLFSKKWLPVHFSAPK